MFPRGRCIKLKAAQRRPAHATGKKKKLRYSTVPAPLGGPSGFECVPPAPVPAGPQQVALKHT